MNRLKQSWFHLGCAFSFLFQGKAPKTRLNMRETLQWIHRFYGMFSAVAKELDVTPQHVRAVAIGNRNSSRVMEALEREFQKILATEIEA